MDHPELVRVRLELAHAFFLKEEDSLARRHFEQVLAGTPPAAVAANIRRFLDIMRARRRWEAHFGLAVAPDSNLNAASGERTVFLDTPFGRLPFTLDGDVSRKSGIGVSLWGGGEYQIPLSPALRLRAGADASAREYKGGAFDRHSLSAHIGPAPAHRREDGGEPAGGGGPAAAKWPFLKLVTPARDWNRYIDNEIRSRVAPRRTKNEP